MKTNGIWKRFGIIIGAAIVLFVLATAMAICGFYGRVSSYDAFADTETLESDVFEPHMNMRFNDENLSSVNSYLSDFAVSDTERVYMLKISMDSNDPDDSNFWFNKLIDNFSSKNNGYGLMYFTRKSIVKFVDDKGNEDIYEIFPETVVGTLNHYTTTDYNYAYISSAVIEGTTYKGEKKTYNVYEDWADIVAGVYKLTSCVINYHFKAVTKYGETTITTVKAKDGTVTLNEKDIDNLLLGDSNSSEITIKGYQLVLTTEVNLNSDYLSAYSDNFGLSNDARSYTGENVYDLVSIHKDGNISDSDGKFYFSADNRKLVNSIGNGFGSSYASSATTNFAAIQDYISVDWCKKTIIYDSNDSSKISQVVYSDPIGIEVYSAGDYGIKLSCSYQFEYPQFNPIIVKVGGKEFLQDITIGKSELKIDIENSIGITAKTSKGYDNSASAEILFNNINMTAEAWSAIGGFDGDIVAVTQNGGQSLFSFVGSEFEDERIGTGKKVYLMIAMEVVMDEESKLYAISQSYVPVPYRGTQRCTYVEGKGYDLGYYYEITAPNLSVRFVNSDSDGKEWFPESVIYGEYMRHTDFVYKNYIVVDGGIETGTLTGEFRFEEQAGWRIVIGEYDSSAKLSYNTIFLVPTAAQLADDSAKNYIYSDVDGNKYIAYNDRLYRGEYYIVFVPTVVYASDKSSVSGLKIENGTIEVPDSSGASTAFVLNFPTVQRLTVSAKVISVTVNSITLNKTYDGTNKILNYDIGYSGINDEDRDILEFVSEVTYASAAANTGVDAGDTNTKTSLVYNFYLQGKKDASISQSGLRSTIGSYEINGGNKENATGIANIDYGKISPLPLTVEFLETSYSRRYASYLYVVVTGVGIPDGYYYYHDYNGETTNNLSGFCTEDEFDTLFGDSTVIKVRLSGFLNEDKSDGEGFVFNEESTRSDFMLSKMSSDINQYVVEVLRTYDLLSWHDSIKDVKIDVNTVSSADGESYRLEINDGQHFTNYVLKQKSGNYAWLGVEKCEITNEITINGNDSFKLFYDKQSHADDVFTYKVDISGHPEYMKDLVDMDFTTFLHVDSFTTDCTDVTHYHSFNEQDIQGLILSGDYTVTMTIPPTTNYKAYTVSFDMSISPKEVTVYLTYAHRLYGDPEVSYESYRNVADISDHEVYIDGDGNVIPDEEVDNVVGKTLVYAFEKNLAAGNYILYCGFVSGDYIDITDLEQKNAYAEVQLSGGVDKAGSDGRVKASGAAKHNYTFKYVDAILYVDRRPLEITVDPVQTKTYTGQQIAVDYTVSGGPGTLGLYVIGYTPTIGDTPDVWSDEDIDETNADVIESGEYILKVYAKPDGNNADNYAASEERLEVRLTVTRTKIVLRDEVDTDAVYYNEEEYELNNFKYFFVGVDTDGTEIETESTWGSTTIESAKIKDTGAAVDKIINAGVYLITIKVNISNAANILFDSDCEDIEWLSEADCRFVLTLTVNKAEDYVFVAMSTDAISLDGDIYKMVYNGYDEEGDDDGNNAVAFGYNLTFINKSKNDGELNVIITINDVLYGSDTKKYMKSSADDVAAAAAFLHKIDGISYDITTRDSLCNVGTYTIKYYVNDENSINYDPNYISFTREYTFVIEKARLMVYIVFDENDFDREYAQYVPYKIYKTPNADLGEKASFSIVGWVRDEGEDEAITSLVSGIEIDWSDLPENATVNSQCYIGTTGGVAPDNYYLDHTATVSVSILPAESSVVVFGTSDFVRREGYDDEIVYTFDNIYRYDSNNQVVKYTDFDSEYGSSNITTSLAAANAALNRYYYYDYVVYSGVEVKPDFLRMAGVEPINGYEENIGTDGVKIRLVGRFVGEDKYNITDSDIEPCTECRDVGEYVFAVSVNASQNYKAIPEKYYYLKIVKNKLTMKFVENTNDETGREEPVAKIYDKTYKYPSFGVVYSGFVGDDAKYPSYQKVFYIEHISEYDEQELDGISEIGLVLPYYEIFDTTSGAAIMPYNVGTYKVRAVLDADRGYGVSRNYEIEVNYDRNGDEVYPELQIKKRTVSVEAGEVVRKTYDGTDKVTAGLVKKGNYVFIPVVGESESGVVEGDEIELELDLTRSYFGRINVLDENGQKSEIDVKIYFNGVSNKNYDFVTDDDYIILKGIIDPATAEIRFYSDTDRKNLISIRYEVTYDAEPHPIETVVLGVTKNGVREEVSHEVVYSCERTLYESSDAPHLAETYQVQLTVTDTNYVASIKSVELVIKKADVDIVFGGDAVQVYGAIDSAITAKAVKVLPKETFEEVLEVLYYDSNGTLIPDIRIADAGEYTAKATYSGGVNYNEKTGETSFVIKKRGVYVYSNVAFEYLYTGKEVAADLYFEYNGKQYHPDLCFEYVGADGNVYPYNYGSDAASDRYPIDVGCYYVFSNNNMNNFDILDDYRIPFNIVKANVVVKAQDKTVTQSDVYSIELVVSGSVNGERLNKVFSQLPDLEYYSTKNGEKLGEVPTAAGTYKVVPAGGVSDNYNVEYSYGILNINKNAIDQTVNNSRYDEIGDVRVEGSFAGDISLVVRSTDTMEYNQYATAFDSAKLKDEALANHYIVDVYYLKLSNGSVSNSDGGKMTVRIKANYYFDMFEETEEQQVYAVARISADGEIDLLEATREGDYLVFDTDKLEAFALLSTTDISSIDAQSSNYDWVLYVGIAVGAVLIAVALIIVKVRE